MRKYSIIILTLVMCMLLSSCATMKAIMYDPTAKTEEAVEETVNPEETPQEDGENSIEETVIPDENSEVSNSDEIVDVDTSELNNPRSINPIQIIIPSIICLITCIIGIIAQWKLFTKAGEKGWKCLIPFYNMWIMFKIAYGDGVRMFLTWIPFVGFVFLILFVFALADSFGKNGIGFKLGLLLLAPIFFIIMGFSKNIQYVGPKKKN